MEEVRKNVVGRRKEGLPFMEKLLESLGNRFLPLFFQDPLGAPELHTETLRSFAAVFNKEADVPLETLTKVLGVLKDIAQKAEPFAKDFSECSLSNAMKQWDTMATTILPMSNCFVSLVRFAPPHLSSLSLFESSGGVTAAIHPVL